jgi:hypothetical protein
MVTNKDPAILSITMIPYSFSFLPASHPPLKAFRILDLAPMEHKTNTLLPPGRRTRLRKRAATEDEEKGLALESPTQLYLPLVSGRSYKVSHMNVFALRIICCILLLFILQPASAGPMVCALKP